MTVTINAIRSKGGREAASIGTGLQAYGFSFTATAASAALKTLKGDSNLTLPSGFIVTEVLATGAATGGTNPTFDLGTATNDDAFIAEGDANGGVVSIAAGGATGGIALGVKLTTDTVVYGGVGASAPTGGTVSGWIIGFVYTDAARL